MAGENRVSFSPNVPQQFALKSDGELFAGGFADQVRYELMDGRVLYVSTDVAASLNLLDLRPGETFMMCKRWNGDRTQLPHWDVWLTPATERARANQEAGEEISFAPSLRRSIARLNEARHNGASTAPAVPDDPIAPERPMVDRPTPKKAVSAETRAAAPGRLPYDVAFRQALQVVTQGLKESGEQWNDQAKQDALSTILIAMSKAGRIDWNIGGAA